MTIPTCKRIKVSSEQDLRNWLSRNTAAVADLMIVTSNKVSRTKYISREVVTAALKDHGWAVTRSYTLHGNLVGYVIAPS